MMQGGALTPFKNISRTFTSNYIVNVTEGHVVEVKHPGSSAGLIVNISDLSYNSDEATTQNNNNSTATWIKLKKGDMIKFRARLTKLEMSNKNIHFNFTLRSPGGNTLFNIFGSKTYNAVYEGILLESEYISPSDQIISSLCTWQNYITNISYDVIWNIEIYVNGKRAV